jgi:hypothetical protein
LYLIINDRKSRGSVGATALEGFGVGDGVELEEEPPNSDFVATPLLQTIFLPLLIQVNLVPLKVLLDPTFEHDAPAFGFGAAMAAEAEKINARTKARTRPRIEEG